LPACAFLLNSGKFIDYAYLTSVEPQTIIASPGQNLSFTIGYQIWHPTVLPGICINEGIVCTFQLLFIASWIQWPPKTFWSLTEVVPSPGPPGTTGSTSFHLTAPVETGTYYMWFCVNAAHQAATGWAAEPTPPGHIKVIVSTLASTVTVTAKPSLASSSPLSIPLVPVGVGGVAVAVIGSVLVAVRRGKLRIRRGHIMPSITLAETVQQKPTISTGYSDLDGTLAGGIPEGYAVVLVSPSYDERDLLLRRIIDSAISSGRPAFYISSDIERTQDLLARYQSGFYAFSPQADKIQPKPPNLYQLPSIDNLSDHTLSLSLAIRDARAKETAGKMLLVLDTLSDVILRHKGVTTRRWLTDFVGKRKADGFTIVATLNPLAISQEEAQTVVDLFDGVIEIFEKELKERSRRFVVVKKMYGKKYSESELMLDKDKLF
jgi:KaiC/GvpD/RAD55 family RecA-like ATPase